MKYIKKVHKRDYKFVPKKPEVGFSPERNEQIINEIIEETDQIRAKKRREFDTKLQERTDAVATYLHSLDQGGKSSNIEKYFGRRHLAYLRGEEIIRELQSGLTVVKNGKIIKRAGD